MAIEKTILAVGDIFLGPGMAKMCTGAELAKRKAELADLLAGGDLAVGNLECPITESRDCRRGQLFNLKMSSTLVPLLTLFHGLALANNHILDYGPAGLGDTLRILDDMRILHCGAGNNREEAASPALFNLGGLRVAMLAYADRNWYRAGKRRPGTSHWQGRQSTRAIECLARNNDFVIIHFHQGYEFINYPGPEELALARLAVAAGADLVLGHHSHTLLGVNRQGKSLVAYGLGNFIFDKLSFRKQNMGMMKHQAVFRFTIGPHRVNHWDIIPCVCDSYGWPVRASVQEDIEIRQRLRAFSVVLNDQQQTIRCFRSQAAENMVPHAARSLLKLIGQEGWPAFLRRIRRLRWVDFTVLFTLFAQWFQRRKGRFV